jgi:hypothetical protein
MTYAAEVLADSPYVYWKFNDASGNPQDSSGNSRHITGLSGSYTQNVSGINATLGNAISASNDFWAGTDTLGNPFATSWTFECWYRPSNWTAGSPRGIFCWADGLGSDGYWGLRHSDAGQPEGHFEIIRNNGFGAVGTSSGSVNNTINHIVVTLDSSSSTARLYRNGSELPLNTNTVSALNTGNKNLYLNYNYTSSRATYGLLQHVAIYTTALSSTRILAHYMAGNPQTAANKRLIRPKNFGALQMGGRG